MQEKNKALTKQQQQQHTMLKRKSVHIDEQEPPKKTNWSEQFDKNWYALVKSTEGIRILSLIFVLMVMTIFFTNYAEKQKFQLRQLKVDVEDLQDEQKSMKAELIYASRESTIEKKLEAKGFVGLRKPVKVITYSKDEIGY